MRLFGDDILSGRIGLAFLGQGLPDPGLQPLGVIFIWPRLPDRAPTPLWYLFVFFINETRLKSASLEALIGFLAFVVGKL